MGLAANQIGVDARIFVIDCPDADGEDVLGYVVNPTLTLLDPVGGEPAEEVTEEGCLSVPGPYAELPRAFRARVDGVDVQRGPVSIEATGMAARCLQHEVDHLNGTVYVDLLPEEHRERLLAEARPACRPAATCPGRIEVEPGVCRPPGPVRPRRHAGRLLARIHASVREAAAAVGLPEPTAPQLRAMVGPPLQDGFALVLGVPVARRPRAIAAYRAHYAAGALLEATVHAAIRELLAALRAAARSSPCHEQARGLRRPDARPTGLLPAFAGVHGATIDGAVRHKDQVVAAALAAIRTAATRSSSATGRRTCSGPRRTGCRASVPAGDRPRTASWRPRAPRPSRPPPLTSSRPWRRHH